MIFGRNINLGYFYLLIPTMVLRIQGSLIYLKQANIIDRTSADFVVLYVSAVDSLLNSSNIIHDSKRPYKYQKRIFSSEQYFNALGNVIQSDF